MGYALEKADIEYPQAESIILNGQTNKQDIFLTLKTQGLPYFLGILTTENIAIFHKIQLTKKEVANALRQYCNGKIENPTCTPIDYTNKGPCMNFIKFASKMAKASLEELIEIKPTLETYIETNCLNTDSLIRLLSN